MGIPLQATAIAHGYEGLGGEKNGRYFPYQGKADKPGVITIGRGRVLSAAEKQSKLIKLNTGKVLNFQNGLSLGDVDELYESDMAPRHKRVVQLVPNAKDHEAGAMLSLFYNLGETVLSTGTPGKAHRAGNKKLAAAGMLLYVFSAGKAQRGLWRRRMTEALCYLTGEVYVAKDPVRERELRRKIEALGIIELARSLAKPTHIFLFEKVS